ncbi:MAG: response regulator [Planctomycetes bacterium]|nr:response regulator [Planctomycetota bacterium]
MALKPVKQLGESELREEYKRLYGCTKPMDIDRLKTVIGEFQERRLPLPGSVRDSEIREKKKSTVAYVPRKMEIKPLGKIVVADHDKRSSTLIATQLRTIRLEPVIIAHSSILMKDLKHELPLLIIVDTSIEGASATTVISRIRALPGAQEVPVLMVSGVVTKDIVTGAVMCGATDFVKKPYDLKDMIARIKTLIKYDDLVEQDRLRMKTEQEAGGATGQDEQENVDA